MVTNLKKTGAKKVWLADGNDSKSGCCFHLGIAKNCLISVAVSGKEQWSKEELRKLQVRKTCKGVNVSLTNGIVLLIGSGKNFLKHYSTVLKKCR